MNYISVGLSVKSVDFTEMDPGTFLNRFGGADGSQEWGRVTGGGSEYKISGFPFDVTKLVSASPITGK